MIDPVFTILLAVLIAVIGAAAGLSVDVPYIQYGLPMLVLLIGSGIYTLQTEGVTGIADSFSKSIFIGVVSSFLTFLIVQDQS